MKKAILILGFVVLAVVYSLSAMAQTAPGDVNVLDAATGQQLQNEAGLYCPFPQYGQGGCHFVDSDGVTAEGNSAPGCCRVDQLQSQTDSASSEGDTTSAPSQVRRGCCGRRVETVHTYLG